LDREREKHIKYDIQLIEEQKLAKEQILNHPFTFLVGNAGSGKTLTAAIIALDQLFKKNVSKIVITRPTISTEDNGFLPGTLQEKLDPWMVPIRDNFRKVYNKKEKLDQLERDEVIEIVPLTFFRGRTIDNAVCIVDECLPGNTKIDTSDGVQKIKTIIKKLNKGETVNVLSYNIENDCFEFKEVIGHKVSDNRTIVELKFKDVKIRCTPEHKIFTPSGYKMAKDFKFGDVGVFSGHSNKSSLYIDNDDMKNLIIGSLMGDGYAQNLGHNIFRILYTHGIQQQEYCEWKCDILHGKTSIKANNGYAKNLSCVGRTKSIILPNVDVFDKKHIIDNITWQSLAISWMDDGNIYKTLNGGSLWVFPLSLELTTYLRDKLNSMGLEASIHLVKNKYYKININKKSIYFLSKEIAPFVHPTLSYKILPEFRNLCGTYTWSNNLKNYTVKSFTKITNIDVPETVYDIEVKDNNNFVIRNSSLSTSGLVVHNCQNLTRSQLKMCIGRLGKGSRMIFCGDSQQIDLKIKQDSAIWEIEKLKDSKFVYVHELTQNHRHEAVFELLELLK
jgi:phosphate starvation-inducible protein PhoH